MSDDELIASPTPPAEPETEARTKRLPPPWRLPPDQIEFARHIARQLQEADWGLIGSVIQILGAEVVQTLLQETLAIEAQGGWMLLTHPPQTHALPRGLPTPGPELVSDYTVYVASKQWEKVAAALADPEDVLIIEGLCVFSQQPGGMAVYATSATTRNLQMQRLTKGS